MIEITIKDPDTGHVLKLEAEQVQFEFQEPSFDLSQDRCMPMVVRNPSEFQIVGTGMENLVYSIPAPYPEHLAALFANQD